MLFGKQACSVEEYYYFLSIYGKYDRERSVKPAYFWVPKMGRAIAQHFRTLSTSCSMLPDFNCTLNTQQFANHILESLACF